MMLRLSYLVAKENKVVTAAKCLALVIAQTSLERGDEYGTNAFVRPVSVPNQSPTWTFSRSIQE
jgi:hypothetical protein